MSKVWAKGGSQQSWFTVHFVQLLSEGSGGSTDAALVMPSLHYKEGEAAWWMERVTSLLWVSSGVQGIFHSFQPVPHSFHLLRSMYCCSIKALLSKILSIFVLCSETQFCYITVLWIISTILMFCSLVLGASGVMFIYVWDREDSYDRHIVTQAGKHVLLR